MARAPETQPAPDGETQPSPDELARDAASPAPPATAGPATDPPIRALLRREESYAIHALLNIAENPGTNAAVIAEQLAMPRAFMSKVLRRLVEAGYIESTMGRNGGVWLKKAPEEVTLLGLIETMSGPLMLDTCEAGATCVTQRRKGYCRLNRAYRAADLQIRMLLQNIRLSDLADPPAESGAPI